MLQLEQEKHMHYYVVYWDFFLKKEKKEKRFKQFTQLGHIIKQRVLLNH